MINNSRPHVSEETVDLNSNGIVLYSIGDWIRLDTTRTTKGLNDLQKKKKKKKKKKITNDIRFVFFGGYSRVWYWYRLEEEEEAP